MRLLPASSTSQSNTRAWWNTVFALLTAPFDYVAGAGLVGPLLGALVDRRDNSNEVVHTTISLWEANACQAGAVRFPWRWSDVGPGGLVRGLEVDRLLAVHETCSGTLTLIQSAGPAMLYRVPSQLNVPWWERAAPLRHSLFWALRGDRRHLVHAGVVGNDRGGILLVGARGSGKTTVAMASLNHGLRFVADDYVLLNLAQRPEAVSLYNTVSISAEPNAEEKTVLDVTSLRPGSLCESLPVRAVVAPRIRGGLTAVRPISPFDALRAWAPSTIFHMPYDDGAVIASLADIVRRVPCFALDVGDDEAHLATALVQVLEQAAP
jgi:hypothetical protein